MMIDNNYSVLIQDRINLGILTLYIINIYINICVYITMRQFDIHLKETIYNSPVQSFRHSRYSRATVCCHACNKEYNIFKYVLRNLINLIF